MEMWLLHLKGLCSQGEGGGGGLETRVCSILTLYGWNTAETTMRWHLKRTDITQGHGSRPPTTVGIPAQHLSLSRDYMCVCSAAVSQRARDVTRVHVARTPSLNECSNGRGEGRARLLSDADRAPIHQNSPAAMSISEAAQRGKIERSLVSKINKLKFLQSPI